MQPEKLISAARRLVCQWLWLILGVAGALAEIELFGQSNGAIGVTVGIVVGAVVGYGMIQNSKEPT
jgi:hypothetical protein